MNPIVSPGQEIHRILRNPKDHYRVLKSPQLVLILNPLNPVLNLIFYLFKDSILYLFSDLRLIYPSVCSSGVLTRIVC
jgi:hypothetical protein